MSVDRNSSDPASQQIAAELLEVLGDAFVTVDADFRLTYVNSKCEQNSGQTREVLLGQILWDAFPTLLNTPFEALYRRVMADRTAGWTESKHAFRDSWYEARAYPLRDGGLGIHVKDISDRKNAQEGLAETKELLGLACDAGLIGTFCWNFGDGRVRVSPEVAKLYGLTPEQSKQDPAFWYEHLFPEDRERVAAMLQASFEKNEEFVEYDFRVALASGGFRWIHSRANVRYNADGSPLQMVGVNIDVTKLRSLDEQIRAANSKLQQTNDALERFAYMASHDLQEPLRTVGSFSQLLVQRIDQHLDGDSRKFVDFIQDGVVRMRKLISDLLEYATASHEAAGRKIHSDLSHALDLALTQLGPAIHETGSVITHASLPSALVNEDGMVRVFQNLIGNAIKYRNESPRIHVSAEQRGQEWIVCVQDNGIGFDMKDEKRIFDFFQRLHRGTHNEGSGIGLAIVKRIVEEHDGRIWAESMPGEGSRFFFTLPVTPSAE